MKHGDISNHTAPIIAFNVDHLLWEPDDKPVANSLFKKVVAFFTKVEPKLDHRFVKLLSDIWNSPISFTIYLYTRKTGEEFVLLEELLYDNNIAFSRLRQMPNLDEMRFLVANQHKYFFDTDLNFLGSLGTTNAQPISEVGSLLGLGYSYPVEGQT